MDTKKLKHTLLGYQIQIPMDNIPPCPTGNNTAETSSREKQHNDVLDALLQKVLSQLNIGLTGNHTPQLIVDRDIQRLIGLCLQHGMKHPVILRQKKSREGMKSKLHLELVNRLSTYFVIPQEKQRFLQKHQPKPIEQNAWDKTKKRGNFVMARLTSLFAAFMTYLSIAILIPPPVGIIVAAVGAITNLGMNFLLLVTNLKSKETLEAENTGSRWNNFLYGLSLINSSLALSERATKKVVSSWETLQKSPFPVIADIFIVVLLTAEVLYFYSKTLKNFIYKRFKKQESQRKLWLSKAMRANEKNTLPLTPTDVVATPIATAGNSTANVSYLTINHPVNQAIKINTRIQVTQHMPLQTASRLHYLLQQKVDQTVGICLITALINEHCNDISLNINETQHKNTATFKHLNALLLHETVYQTLRAQHRDLAPCFDAYAAQHETDHHFLLKLMKQQYQLRGCPTKEADLNHFFNAITNDLINHHQAKADFIHQTIVGKSTAQIKKQDRLYQRPSRIQVHNTVVDCFVTHFIKARATDDSQRYQFEENYKKNMMTESSIKAQLGQHKLTSLVCASVGTMLSAIALLLIIPGPIGWAAAAMLYLSAMTINYYFIYKQNRDNLAVRADKDLAPEEVTPNGKRLLNTSMAVYMLGDTTASYKIFYDLASAAIKMPIIGLIVLSSLFAACALYRTVAFSFGQINELFKSKDTPPTCATVTTCFTVLATPAVTSTRLVTNTMSNTKPKTAPRTAIIDYTNYYFWQQPKPEGEKVKNDWDQSINLSSKKTPQTGRGLS